MVIGKKLLDKLRQLNLFADAETIRQGDMQALRNQVIWTRIYIILLFSVLGILIVSTLMIEKTTSVTISTPSLVMYEQLETKYSDTLSCPCQEVAVSYSTFLSISATYHQVCLTDLISPKWIASLFNSETARITPLDFRLTAATQFRLLALMCISSMKMVDQIKGNFINGKLVNAHVLSHSSFDDQINAIIGKFYATLAMSTEPSTAAQLIMLTITQSLIYSAVQTDAFVIWKPGSNQTRTVPNFYPRYDYTSFSNDSHNNFAVCSPSNVITYKAGIYDWGADQRHIEERMTPQPPPVFIVNGMRVGCTVYDALRLGTLQCFFDPICLNTTAYWISTLPSDAWPQPLNSSIPSYYLVDSTIESMIQRSMVDQWSTVKNFSKYFSACAPFQCTYKITQHNELIYVITLLISLFGGVTVVLRLVTPVIVRFVHYIYSYFKKQNSVQSPQLQQERWYTRIVRIIARIKMVLVSLNLFKDDLSDELLGIRATRVHVALVVSSVIIITFYSSLIVHIRSVSVITPSLSAFEHLYDEYSTTLTCPCSQVAIPHSEIITMLSPRYHQICTSMFVQPVWIHGFFDINFTNSSKNYTLADMDFRVGGALMFSNLISLCRLAIITVAYTEAVFSKDEFVSAQTLSRLEFTQHANALIFMFQTRTAQNMALLLAIIRIFLAGAALQGDMVYQSLMVNGSSLIRRYSPAPSAFGTCACSVSMDCPKNGGNFFCINGNNCTAGTTVWTTPGLVTSCLNLDGLLNSDLRCFYNQTCLNIFLSMYNVDIPTRDPLPAATLTIPVLNSSALSHFLPNDSVGTILGQLMVEMWFMEGNFEGYYKICAPSVCSYTISQQFDVVYMMATITGLIGGLLVIFRLIVPIGARLVQWLLICCRHQLTDNDNIQPVEHTAQQHPIGHTSLNFRQMLFTLNLFKKESSISKMKNVNSVAIIATRLYLVLLTTSVFVLVLFNSLKQTTISVTVKSPSVVTFEQLYEKYSTTISCPCQQIAVPYSTFLSVSASFHQVCTSAFVSPLWTTSLYGYGSTVNSYLQLDRPILSKQHQLMGWLCEESQIIVNSSISNFNQSILITSTALPRASFVSQTDEIVRQLIEQTPLDFRRMFSFTVELAAGALLPTIFNTDWSLENGNISNDYILRSVPREFANSTCNCVVSNTCQEYLRIGPPELILPGLVVGCWPIHGLSMSTLECFYSFSCINTIISYLDYYTEMDGSAPTNFTLPNVLSLNIDSLNSSVTSRFTPNTIIDTLIYQLFIEEWKNTSIYENYYAVCMPSECRYEYSQQNGILYVITAILFLYGGLTVSLKFLIWNTMVIYYLIKDYLRVRSITVQPWTISN